MKTKICKICGKELFINYFYKDKNSKDKLFNFCKKCHREKNRKWYLLNKEKLKEYFKIYFQKNKKIIYKQQIAYRRKRRKTDINYNILKNLRKRLEDALKVNRKSARTVELLGCSIDKLKEHLVSKFTSGMSWSNYGKWHIDHIRPCASFDLSKPEEQRKCFNYNNLQPLWAKENKEKGKKIII